MKTKNHSLNHVLTCLLVSAVFFAGIINISAKKAVSTITIANEHLYKQKQADGTYKYKFVMDVTFPNPSDIRNPHTGSLKEGGIYSIKLNRIDGKREHINAYVAMDYSRVGGAGFVEATIFDTEGNKPLATSKQISTKDAVEE